MEQGQGGKGGNMGRGGKGGRGRGGGGGKGGRGHGAGGGSASKNAKQSIPRLNKHALVVRDHHCWLAPGCAARC